MHSDEDMLGLLLTEKKELQEGEVTDLSCSVCTQWLSHRESNLFAFFHVGLVVPPRVSGVAMVLRIFIGRRAGRLTPVYVMRQTSSASYSLPDKTYLLQQKYSELNPST